MELRHIRYFIALAEELNFSRAAERLHISQPPLSRQIQELEEEIGATLFYRTKRYVELTNAGKVFLNKAYQILDQVEQACMSTRLSSTGSEGEFRVGFTGAVQDLIPTIQEFRIRYPKIGIILNHLSSAKQAEALHENTIDIGFISTPINSHKIEVIPIKKMTFEVALPENHVLATKKNIYLSDLIDETFIMTPKAVGALFYEMFMGIFKEAGLTPNISIQAHDLQTVLALVSAGMGITLTPSPFEAINGIIKREIADANITMTGYLAWQKENQSDTLKKFLSFFFDFHEEELKLLGK